MYHWIVYLHVIAAFAYAMLHGASANVAFKLRREKTPERIAALLDLSSAYNSVTYAALFVILFTGVTLGFLGHWWSQVWIWLVLGVIILMIAAMFTMGAGSFTQLRKAAGLPYFDGKSRPALPPASSEEIAARAAAINPIPLAIVGFGGLALLVWLMMFKPF
jgi:hypothetical protein